MGFPEWMRVRHCNRYESWCLAPVWAKFSRAKIWRACDPRSCSHRNSPGHRVSDGRANDLSPSRCPHRPHRHLGSWSDSPRVTPEGLCWN